MDQLYFVVHTHWDREWYQPFQRMRMRLVEMTDRMIAMIERGELPFFHFDGQTIVLQDYLEVRPENTARLRRLISTGKVQIGPWYVLADSFLVDGESLIRNLEIGMRIARRFGEPLRAGYLPDQFGHAAQLPQILAGFGFETALLWRGVGPDVTRNRFVWEALDGSAVLTAYLPTGYANGLDVGLGSPESFRTRCAQIAAREASFIDGAPLLVMNGNDHATPDPRIVVRIGELRAEASRDGQFECELGTIDGYLARLKQAGSGGLAVHRGELRSPLRAHLLPGVTSARAWIKQRDFENCYLLERIADPLVALANANGLGQRLAPYLQLAWRHELENHPHDSICGCSIDQVHEDMRYRFDQAQVIAEQVICRASTELLAASGAPGVAVFNPTFATSAVVSGELRLARWDEATQLVDAAGRTVAAEMERGKGDRLRLTFVAGGLRQAGFSFYRLQPGGSTEPGASPTPEPAVENEFYRVAPGPRGLTIEDKRSAERLELYFEDEGDRGDEYNFDPVPADAPIAAPVRIETASVKNQGVQRQLRLLLTMRLPRALTAARDARSAETVDLPIQLRASVYPGIERVDFEAVADNRAADHRLRAALRTPVSANEAVSDTSFGVVRRPLCYSEPRGTEDLYPTAPHRTFTAVEGAKLSAALIARGLLEAELRPAADGSTILLTLLRCVGWLSRSDLVTRRGGAGPELETPGAQELGTHRFEFALSTWQGELLKSGFVQLAQAYAYPPRLFAVSPTLSEASLGATTEALCGCDNPRIAFSTARADAGRPNRYRVRVWSISPNEEKAHFIFPAGFAARTVDLRGRGLTGRRARLRRDGRLQLAMRPFEIVTFEVRKKTLREAGQKD